MNDFVTSLIRTYAPLAVGAVAGWVLATFGFEVPKEQVAEVTALAIAGATAVYYAGARLLEKRWPALGWLLGRPAQPRYDNAATSAEEAGEVTIGQILIVGGILLAVAVGFGFRTFGAAGVVILALAVVLVGIGALKG